MKFAPLPDQLINRPLTSRQLGAQTNAPTERADKLAWLKEAGIGALYGAAGAAATLLVQAWWAVR